MTENEAIKEMKYYSEEEYGKGLVAESHKIAIQALEEIQEYRAIGTVEECRAAVQRNKPKKPLYNQGTRFMFHDCVKENGKYINVESYANHDACPNCKADVFRTEYCYKCGQVLDWSKEGEKV